MELFDSHFHWGGEGGSPQEYCRQIERPERVWLMSVGGSLEESRLAARFAREIPYAWFAAGVHPQNAAPYQAARPDFGEFRAEAKLKAIGELGLDYFYEASDRQSQRRTLEEFLALALEWKLPAVIHLRDRENLFEAYEDGYAMLRDFAAGGGGFVVHCFSGTPEWAERFLELGAMLGVTGIVTFRKAENIRRTLQVIPDDRLLVETDSPYLAPVPHRGRENHPGFLIDIAERLAVERGRTLAEIAELTTRNAFEFYRINRESEGK